MTYEEFLKFVPAKCMYETIYDDSDGRTILVIRLLDAFGMVNKAQREWVGLTDEEILRADPWMGTSDSNINPYQILLKVRTLEAKLKERNT